MWGFWTKQKLSILADYLAAFGKASQSARRTLYLDLFAGQDRNLSRETGEPISGSPRVALDAQPPFTKLVFLSFQARRRAFAVSCRRRTKTGISR